tara:strand:- start:536 stop:1972 length:1437 start_codon:yes stop_codon:yes gene_type:complete
MKEKILTSSIKAFLNIFSDKNNKEVKKTTLKNILKSVPVFASAYYLPNLNADTLKDNQLMNDVITKMDSTGLSPMELIQSASDMGLTTGGIQQFLWVLGGYYIFRAVGSADEMPYQDELASYGNDLCPYNSFIISENDFRAKNIQLKINSIYTIAYEFKRDTIKRNFFRGMAIATENAVDFISPKYKKVLDFLGKSEKGFELMTYKNDKYTNPRLIKDLPIPNELKEIIRPDVMDLNNEKRIEDRKFVNSIRLTATKNTNEEIKERNVNLALVKMIDQIKQGEKKEEDLSNFINDIQQLTHKVSTEWRKKYVEVSYLAKYIFDTKKIDNIIIKNYDKNLENKYERAYHIMRELDRICYEELKCKPLKKPLPYREIYRNELIMAVQNRLRDKHVDIALINRQAQNESPLIREHYFNYTPDLISKLEETNFRILKNRLYSVSEEVELSEEKRTMIAKEIKGKGTDNKVRANFNRARKKIN